MQRCSNCHAAVDDDAIFCDQCGYRLKQTPRPATSSTPAKPSQVETNTPSPSDAIICPTCGYSNQLGEEFCVNCGVQLAMPAMISPQSSEVLAVMASGESPASTAVQQVIVPVGARTCPTCGTLNPASENYCQVCGFWLSSQPAVRQPAQADKQTQATQPSVPVLSAFDTHPPIKITGKLVALATNTTIPLPAKVEIVLGRRDPERGIYPDVDLSAQGSASSSVSRQHARLLIDGTQLFIEDLNSTNSTYLNRQRIQPGQLYLLNHGDELRLGGVVLVYYSM